MSNAPPGKARARRQTGRRRIELTGERVTTPDKRASRDTQLVCIATRTLIDINGKLGDIATLAQQQNDLIRRILEREALR